MTRNGGVRPAEKAAQEKEKEKAAKETAGKMELGDVDEEYYPSDARPAEKGELLLSRTLALRCPKGFAFIKSSEFEQFKENWQEMKGKKKSQGSMANGGVDPMSWRSGIFDRHKVAEPYSGGGHAAPVAPVAPVPKQAVSTPTVPPAKKEVDPAILEKVETIKATPVLEVPLAGGDKPDEECTEEELAERKKQRKAIKKREKEIAKQELRKKLEDIANAKKRVEEIENQKKESRERKQQQLRAGSAPKPGGYGFNQYDNMFNDMLPPTDSYVAKRPDPYANRSAKPNLQLGSNRTHKRMRDGRVITNRRMLREAQIEDERQKRKNALMRSCRDVLNHVKRNKFHWIFAQPVDAVKLGIPDYYEIVKNPMDLGKVKEKLDGKKYPWPTDFADDMRLIFDNCALYNGTTTDAGQMGETVRAAFEEGWVKYNVEQKMSDEDDARTKEDIEIANTPEDPIRQEEVFAEEQAKMLAEMKRELAELKRQKAGGYPRDSREGLDGLFDDDFDANIYDDDPDEYAVAKRARSGGGKPRSRATGSGSGQPKPKRPRATPQSKVTKDRAYIELDQEPLPTREMTFDEKHALTMSLQELPESKQEMVITIVQEGQAAMGKAEGDEIEINIEELDSNTLWRLRRYCDSQLKSKKSKKSASAMDLVKEAKAREAAAMRELEACEATLKKNPKKKASNADLPAAAGGSSEKPVKSDSSDSDSDSDSDSSSSEGGDSNPEKGKAAGSAGNDDGTSNIHPVSRVEQSTNQLLQPAVDELGIKRDQKQPVAAVQNPEGWSDLNKKDDTANTGAAAGAPGAAAVDASAPTEAVDAVPDDLWSDFEAAATQKKDIEANRNAEIEKREKEIAEAEQKLKDEQAQKEKEEQEKIQKQKEEEEAKILAEEEEREKARAAARAELQAETKQTINIEEQREAMKEFGGEGMVSGMEKHAAQIKEALGNNGNNGEQA